MSALSAHASRVETLGIRGINAACLPSVVRPLLARVRSLKVRGVFDSICASVGAELSHCTQMHTLCLETAETLSMCSVSFLEKQKI